MKVCIVGASGKLEKYMVQHALDRGYEVVGVCSRRIFHLWHNIYLWESDNARIGSLSPYHN